jgi:hypothetical protein
MKRHNLSQALSFSHVTELTTPASVGEADRTEPIAETALAREMARIMQRTPAQDLAIVANAKPRWLGDDADRAIVDAYLASDTQAGVAPTYKVTTTSADSWGPEPVYSADTTAQWLRHARRERLRNRLDRLYRGFSGSSGSREHRHVWLAQHRKPVAADRGEVSERVRVTSIAREK